MKIISNKIKITQLIHNKKSLGFVPTMGGIHLGHISLIKRSIRECANTVVSIFINKQQFNKESDFITYPRTLNKDISKIRKLKVNVLYLPTVKEIYPNGYNKKIKIDSFGKKLCGKFRPRHFEAVADVIDRFIKIIKPNKIYFGQKDMQQLKIMEDFIIKNHPSCKVVACKTIRELNGIACSSRNEFLSKTQKIIASKVIKLLMREKRNLIYNKISVDNFKKILHKLGVSDIDYIDILDVNKLIKPYKKKNKYKVFIAYHLGMTRLIDNI